MSIINEALKKTQSKLQTAQKISALPTSPQEPTLTPFSESNHFVSATLDPPSKEIRSQPTHWPLIFLILGFLILFIIIFTLLALSIKKTSDSAIIVDRRETKEILIPQKPHTSQKDEYSPPLKLQGVMMMKNKPAALINDEVYEEGEYIRGMHIQRISIDQVELSHKNQTIILKIK